MVIQDALPPGEIARILAGAEFDRDAFKNAQIPRSQIERAWGLQNPDVGEFSEKVYEGLMGLAVG